MPNSDDQQRQDYSGKAAADCHPKMTSIQRNEAANAFWCNASLARFNLGFANRHSCGICRGGTDMDDSLAFWTGDLLTGKFVSYPSSVVALFASDGDRHHAPSYASFPLILQPASDGDFKRRTGLRLCSEPHRFSHLDRPGFSQQAILMTDIAFLSIKQDAATFFQATRILSYNYKLLGHRIL